MTSTITRILFATDLSPGSGHAFGVAATLARATGAEIHILHVCEALSEDARVTLQMFMQNEKAQSDALERRVGLAREALKSKVEGFLETLPEGAGLDRSQLASAAVVEGFAPEVILREAKRLDCDMIVLGAHEHGFSHTFLGDTAKRVLRRAEIPTLIVPQRPTG